MMLGFMWKAMLTVLAIPGILMLGDSKSVLSSSDMTSLDEANNGREIVTLQDFTKDEVKGVGITLSRDVSVHISGVGGGDRSFWRDWNFSDDDRSSQMFAAGWIIDAKTRKPVWEMTMENTTGKTARRECDETIKLKQGSYEVYYAAYGFVSRSPVSGYVGNIDRREINPKRSRLSRTGIGKFFKELFGSDDFYEEFMDYARNEWRLTIHADDLDASSISLFSAPQARTNSVFAETRVGDNAAVRKGISVAQEVTIHIYALGEGRNRDEMFDYGWIVNRDTRERMWEMRFRNSGYAGGARKNLVFDGDVTLPKGTYDLIYCTDGSHSSDDWNSLPPADPFNYGVTLLLKNEKDRNTVKVIEPEDIDKNAFVQITKTHDSDFKSSGFTLNGPTKLHVYGLGESSGDTHEMADYGWITDAKTHERVWSMDGRETYHGGGATKNRLVDEIITLPKGKYIASYQTDDSHAYDDWNADPPFDKEHWGLTISSSDKNLDPAHVKAFSPENEDGVIVQLIRVRDGRHARKNFTLDRPAKVRIYALGESDGQDMADYGWIENTTTGETVWEMTYRMTSSAGGARKNRMVNKTLLLERGDYELHYKTDGSHAFGEWNDDPPEDQTHWGITLYKEE